MLGGMWKKLAIVPCPILHLLSGVGSVSEITSAGINISEGDYVIVSIVKQVLNATFQLFFFGDSAVILDGPQFWHRSLMAVTNKLPHEGQEYLFCLTLHQ